ncbi:Si-specific NAD(P)(+) transhydrogenase [Turneriella parva]|uniref:Soluble pyridine nucleotide transhydrogenase n=1 Tax=Turneriella parva (strain ATCC BAA-1111 / DSM 21527 / NCTC 11395 / H) TaxID=869212 RepID=I4B0V1_TURPD|nr:Si-specific NAD(P)(+) transhydrogenase [Turneriella parva]AFM10908.1 FAD-dependent pyridine nucleotide-disulfide oxidoreductase [Turneriella parva DSM 21527]
MTRYDVVVIGSGPAGEGAAMQCAKDGKHTAIVELNETLGGECLHRGTIPSKALRHSIQRYIESMSNPLVKSHVNFASRELDFPQMLAAARKIIEREAQHNLSYYERNRVDVYGGRARIVTPNEIQIEMGQRGTETIQADAIIVATGSRPYHPPDIKFDDHVLDSDTVLELAYTPRSITIYGAGVIGCEYASIFKGLGIKVTLVNHRAKLLEFLDDEIIDALSYHLREQGIVIKHGEEYEKVERDGNEVQLHLKSGKIIKSEALLWANGRSGNSAGLFGFESGIEIDHRGQIKKNENFQTALPHIYAVGDVSGPPALASAAFNQGRFVALHITRGTSFANLVQRIPTGIYTAPEISSLGKTERELTAEKVPYEVGQAHFRNIARAQITGQTAGLLKILFHRETLEILGIHCFGDQAAEIIHIGQAIMSQPAPNNRVTWFVETTFNYPTMAEAYRVAALNGINRL